MDERTKESELRFTYLPESRGGDEYIEETVPATLKANPDDGVFKIITETDELVWEVREERGEILICPHTPAGFVSTVSTADYQLGEGTFTTGTMTHNDRYLSEISGDGIADTLGELVSEAREQFKSDHGIRPVSEIEADIPEIRLEVRQGNPLFPSSNSSTGMARREALVVEPVEPSFEYDVWKSAIVQTTKRYIVWTGNYHNGTDELLAPNDYEAGDVLTLPEYLDEWYLVDPQEVAEKVTEVREEKREQKRREELYNEHPGLRKARITNYDAFDEARESGSQVQIGKRTTRCSDSAEQCSTDIIRFYATPDGEVEKDQIHTY